MNAFSGETTTTSGLDGGIFTFRATSTAVRYIRVFSSPVAKGIKLLHTHFFYLSIVEVIQNERKANFVTLYDRNLSSKRARYVYNVGSINDSRINVKKCASRNGLKLRSANTARSMCCNTAV